MAILRIYSQTEHSLNQIELTEKTQIRRNDKPPRYSQSKQYIYTY